MAFVRPPEIWMKILLIFFKNREEALTRACNNRIFSLNFGYLKEGWKEIDDVSRSVSKFIVCLETLRPVRDQRSGDSAFMSPGFVFFERGVGSS